MGPDGRHTSVPAALREEAIRRAEQSLEEEWKIESHRCTIASSIVKYSCVNTRANSRHVVTMASVSGGSKVEKDEVKGTT